MSNIKSLTDAIFKKAKEDFFSYISKKDISLLPKAQDLFNYEIKSINNILKLKIILNEHDILIEQDLDINQIHDLSSIIKKKVIPYNFVRDMVLVILNNNDTEVFKEVVQLNNIKSIDKLIKNNSNEIYNKIGKLDVTLVHDNRNLFETKINFSNLISLVEKIKINRDTIYTNYIQASDNKIKQHDRENWYGHDQGFPSPIIDFLIGNFIISENDEFLTDEKGNFITF